MGPFLFELEGIEKYYGPKLALSLPHLALEEGKIYSLAGSNGAGKSSLLKILNLLEPPTSGTVRFRGQEITDWGNLVPLRREMAGVLQEPYLWKGTVFQNVAAGLIWRRCSKRELAGQVSQALAAVGLSSFESRKARELSGGEGKRVALARALAVNPRVLLLDEPTANLDKGSTELIEEAIVLLNRKEAVSVIFATHDLSQAHRLADKVVPLSNGKLARSLLNVFRGQVKQLNGVSTFTSGRMSLRLITESIGAFTICLDESDIILSKEKLYSSAQNSLPGKVVGIEEAGTQVRVSIDVGEELVAIITRASFQDLGISLGSPVYATFKSSAVQVLG